MIPNPCALSAPFQLPSLCSIELSDLLFAIDSVPAVFGVTTDPFLAFTSNGFAILGLRALYTLVANAVAEFEYLRPAIAAVLAFIGLKLIGGYIGFEARVDSNSRPNLPPDYSG